MASLEKLYLDVMSGKRDSNINFNDLCKLLESLGISLQRITGSHHIYAYPEIMELIDLQPDKHDHSKAKNYQVKQVRQFLIRYRLGV